MAKSLMPVSYPRSIPWQADGPLGVFRPHQPNRLLSCAYLEFPPGYDRNQPFGFSLGAGQVIKG